jgi:biopolymer transport protein TolQ
MNLLLASANAFTLAYTQSDFFGKIVILSLTTLSIISWIVLVHKIWTMREVSKLSKLFQEAIHQNKHPLLTLDNSIFPQRKNSFIPHPFQSIYYSTKEKAIEILNKNRDYISETMGKAPAYLTSTDLEILESHVTATISSQNKILEKNLFILSTIITLAPFLGLLGTVWGILETFAGLHQGGSIGSNISVLGGISTALATTVLGLIVAIPALVAYNYLKTTIRNYACDMDNFLTTILSNIELQYRRIE